MKGPTRIPTHSSAARGGPGSLVTVALLGVAGVGTLWGIWTLAPSGIPFGEKESVAAATVPSSMPVPLGTPIALTERIAELEAAAEQAASERELLLRELSELRRLIAQSQTTGSQVQTDGTFDVQELRSGEASTLQENRISLDLGIDGRLQRLGLDADAAASLRARFDEAQLSELYLENQARREHWGFTELHAARTASRNELRQRVGDTTFDQLLWLEGTPNRVEIVETYAGSEAARLGLQPDDLIYSYAGKRIFVPEEIQELTASGTPGEPVDVEIRRGGKPRIVTARRGPLGVQIQPEREAPSDSE